MTATTPLCDLIDEATRTKRPVIGLTANPGSPWTLVEPLIVATGQTITTTTWHRTREHAEAVAARHEKENAA